MSTGGLSAVAITSTGKPMANYASARRAGDFLFLSGVVAVDPARQAVLQSYDELPADALASLKRLGYVTGQMTVDIYEAPAVVQSWFVLDRIRQIAAEHGGTMDDVVKLVQYFRDLRHYPFYNRVRGLFYPGEPPASTVVEVSRFMPGDGALIEVEATIYLPT
jgi:enamine deaminase RidA (YjgF/YER057c/UK114 family)